MPTMTDGDRQQLKEIVERATLNLTLKTIAEICYDIASEIEIKNKSLAARWERGGDAIAEHLSVTISKL